MWLRLLKAWELKVAFGRCFRKGEAYKHEMLGFAILDAYIIFCTWFGLINKQLLIKGDMV
jgi:hypothetical protein